MKGLDLGNKNMFVFRFLCLFTFRQHKQLPMLARFFKSYASLEVTRPREVATDLTLLTGFSLIALGWAWGVQKGRRRSQAACLAGRPSQKRP
jgi:hypothetical protein